MKEEKENDFDQNFAIDISAEQMATIKPWDGAGFMLCPKGDFTWDIIEVRPHTPENKANPKVSIRITFECIADLTGAHPEAIGMRVDNFYAGQSNAHRKQQERLACLLKATGVQLTPGKPFQPRVALLGQRIDGTIVWDLGDEQIDQDTGARKRFANARLIAERSVGAPRPPQINIEALSARATKWINSSSETDATDTNMDAGANADAPPWGQNESAGTPEPVSAPIGFAPEDQVPADVHAYRARMKLDPTNAQALRDILVGNGYDPDGPVDAAKLLEPTKSAWIKLMTPAAVVTPQLPGLPSLPKPGANGPAPKPSTTQRTGQRAPRA